MPTSRPYQEYLIESLKDPDEAKAYLESDEEDYLDALFSRIADVIEARISYAQREKFELAVKDADLFYKLKLVESALEWLGFRDDFFINCGKQKRNGVAMKSPIFLELETEV